MNPILDAFCRHTNSITMTSFISILFLCLSLTVPAKADTAMEEPTEIPIARGRVVGTNGAGMGGVSVELYAIVNQKEFPFPIQRLDTKTTDPDGFFTFPITAEFSDLQKLFVVAQAEGFSIGWEQLFRIVDESRSVVMDPETGTLEGTVVNLSGQAIANATVSAVVEKASGDAEELMFAMASTPMMTAKTGADGRFSIGKLPLSTRAEIVVIAEAYPKTFSWRTDQGLEKPSMAPGQPGIEILLSRETGVYGQLIDSATGKPVANEKVYLIRYQKGRTLPTFAWHFVQGTVLMKTMGDDNRECVTTPNGVFVATGLPAGEYRIGMDPFTHPDRRWIAQRQSVQVEEGKVARVPVPAIHPARVTLLCVNRDQQKPVDGMQVKIVSIAETGQPESAKPSAGSGAVTVLKTALSYEQTYLDPATDEKGQATMTLAPGRYRIESVAKEGYKKDDVPVEFEAHAGEEQTVKIPVVYESDKVGIWGTCQDESGRPLVGVRFRVLAKQEISCTSDPSGRFQLRIPPGNRSILSGQPFFVAEHPETDSSVTLKGTYAINKDHTVILKRSRSLSGRVVNPSGMGIDQAVVTVGLSQKLSPDRNDILLDEDEFLPVCTQKTDSRGVFRIGLLDPDRRYVLHIQSPGYGRHSDLIEPRIPGTKDPGSLAVNLDPVTLSANNLELSGIVVDNLGYPISGIRFVVSGIGQAKKTTAVSGSDGRLRFDNLAPGQVTLNLADGSMFNPYILYQSQFEAGTGDLRIILVAREKKSVLPANQKRVDSTVLRITALDHSTQKAIPGAVVGIQQPHGNDFFVPCDVQGHATIYIGPGLHKVRIDNWPQYAPYMTKIEVEIGKAYSIEGRLMPRRKIIGYTFSPEGKPLGNVSIRIVTGSYGTIQTPIEIQSEDTGRFELDFDRVPESEEFVPYLEAVIDDYRYAAAIELPKTDETLNIRLQPTTTLVLQTRNSKGQSVKTSLLRLMIDGKIWYPSSGQDDPNPYDLSDIHTFPGLILPPNHHLFVELGVIGGSEIHAIPDELLIPGATSTLEITVKESKSNR
jgi:hypothetical protein